MKKLAPIVLFTYNRLSETRKTVMALQNNHLAIESDLYVFSDGSKNTQGEAKVKEVRKYLKTINGFKSVIIKETQGNKGLANSIIDGVTEIIEIHGCVIVLEDDLISSTNFLSFMNQALDFYQDSPKVISVSGYSPNLNSLLDYEEDFYVGLRASSWGWGTWKDNWVNVDWEVKDYNEFNKSWRKKLNFYRISNDMPRMLKGQMNGEIDSWAIRWGYHQFKQGLYTIFPTKSKIDSIGDGIDATHTAGVKKFKTPLDYSNKHSFVFNLEVKKSIEIWKEHKSIFSFRRRLIDKMKRILISFKN